MHVFLDVHEPLSPEKINTSEQQRISVNTFQEPNMVWWLTIGRDWRSGSPPKLNRSSVNQISCESLPETELVHQTAAGNGEIFRYFGECVPHIILLKGIISCFTLEVFSLLVKNLKRYQMLHKHIKFP